MLSSNKVELLEDNVIYVEKVGVQTEASFTELYEKITKLATQLRVQKKPVLILSNASKEGKMDVKAAKAAAEVGTTLDYDRSATYGASDYLRFTRDFMIEMTELNQKVANFATKKEALKWLLS